MLTRCCIAALTMTVLLSRLTSSSRILLLTPHIGSHLMEIQRLGASLVARGHQAYLAVQEMHPSPMIYPGIKPLWYHAPDGVSPWQTPKLVEIILSEVFHPNRHAIMPSCDEITAKECEYMLHDKKFMSSVENLNFDLAIVDFLICSPCNGLVPHHFRIPYVFFSSNSIGWRARDPALPSFVTTFLTPLLSDHMTFPERLRNTAAMLYHELYYHFTTADDHLFNEFAPDLGTWNELIRKSKFFIVLDDPVCGWPTPTLPNVVRIPTMGTVPAPPLEGEIATLARSAKDGVIVVSFGTFVSIMPASIVEKFVSAFARVKQTVIWRAEVKNNPSLHNLPANVHAFPWLPQAELLADSATRLFITHAGNNGYHEAVYHGVPMVAFPLIGDQPHYAFRIAYHHYGINMDVRTFTADELLNAINTVLNDPTYRQTTIKASAILKSRPMTGVQTATYWVEHILKFGGQHLRSYAQDMPWYQFYMVDMFFAFIIVLFLVFYTVILIVKFISKFFVSKRKIKKNKKVD